MNAQHGCEDKSKEQTGRNFADPRARLSDNRMAAPPPHLLHELGGQLASPLLQLARGEGVQGIGHGAVFDPQGQVGAVDL